MVSTRGGGRTQRGQVAARHALLLELLLIDYSDLEVTESTTPSNTSVVFQDLLLRVYLLSEWDVILTHTLTTIYLL